MMAFGISSGSVIASFDDLFKAVKSCSIDRLVEQHLLFKFLGFISLITQLVAGGGVADWRLYEASVIDKLLSGRGTLLDRGLKLTAFCPF